MDLLCPGTKDVDQLAEVRRATSALKNAFPHPAEDPIIFRPIHIDVLETPCFEFCTSEVDGDAPPGVVQGADAYSASAQEVPKAYAQEARKTTPRSLPKVSYGSDADSVKVFPFAVTLAQIPLLKPGECVHKGSSETGVSGRQSSTNGQTGQRCGNKRLAGVKWPLSSWYPLWALRLKPFSAKLLRVRRSMGYPEV